MAEKNPADESEKPPSRRRQPAAKKADSTGTDNKREEREARLAEALRANLRRRKAAQKKDPD